MNNLYIHNKGTNKTLIRSNNKEDIKQLDWDAEYTGEHANISLDFSEKGDHNHYKIQLTNSDLETLFSIPSINQPLHKRLKDDFLNKTRHKKRTHISSLLSGQQYITRKRRKRMSSRSSRKSKT